MPCIPRRNVPPLHTDNTLLDESNMDDVKMCSSAAVIHSSRHVAVAPAVVSVLGAAAAEAVDVTVSAAAAAAASTETGGTVL